MHWRNLGRQGTRFKDKTNKRLLENDHERSFLIAGCLKPKVVTIALLALALALPLALVEAGGVDRPELPRGKVVDATYVKEELNELHQGKVRVVVEPDDVLGESVLRVVSVGSTLAVALLGHGLSML